MTAIQEVREVLARYLGAPAAAPAGISGPGGWGDPAGAHSSGGPGESGDPGDSGGPGGARGLGGADAALAALTLICERDLLAPLVEDLLADAATGSAEAQARARLSYRHALGFHKTMLLAGPPAYMLRAHVWQPRPPAQAAGPGPDSGAGAGAGAGAGVCAGAGSRPAAGLGNDAPPHIHNHRFAFSSAVLRGALRMRLYLPDGDAAPMAAYREEIAGDDAEWQIRRTGSRGMRMAADLRMAAGSVYCLDADACHQVLPVRQDRGVTVFLETATRRAWTDVYAPSGAPSLAGSAKEPLGTADYANALRELRALLAG